MSSLKDGKIRWWCPVHGGRQHQYTVRGGGERHAKLIQREIDASIDRGVCWRDERARAAAPPPVVPSLTEAVADHIRARSRALAPGTVQLLVVELGLLLDVAGEDATVADLSTVLLGRYYDALLQGRPVQRPHHREPQLERCSPATAAGRVRKVERLWRWLADDERYAEHTPRPRRLADLPSPMPAHRLAPTWEEMDRAVEHAWGWYGDLCLVLRCTGLRIGQVARLQWEDIDLDAQILRVRPELGKSRQERRGRVIPLAPVLVTELAGWGRREGPLFGGRPQHHPLARAWERAGVREEIWKGPEGGRGQPAHAFRHGFITGLRALGADRDLVGALVGHAGGTVTDERYTDYTQGPMGDRLREVVALVPPVGEVARVLPYAGRGFRARGVREE